MFAAQADPGETLDLGLPNQTMLRVALPPGALFQEQGLDREGNRWSGCICGVDDGRSWRHGAVVSR
jgi:hypothetical protein